jgi:hypothetical protein
MRLLLLAAVSVSLVLSAAAGTGTGSERSDAPAETPGNCTGPCGAVNSSMKQFQHLMEHWAKARNVGLSLGIVAGGTEFTATAGTNPANKQSLTASDTLLFGSGTKAFVGARVMQLVEKGTISLGEPVSKYVDPLVAAWGLSQKPQRKGLTFAQLFEDSHGSGSVANKTTWSLWSSQITVGHCIEMKSGLADWDGVDCKNGCDSMDGALSHSLAAQPDRLWSPFDFIEWIAQERDGPPFWFQPGTKCSYTSTGYQVVGLVLAAVQWAQWGPPPAKWTSLNMRTVFESLNSTLVPDKTARYRSVHFYNNEQLSKYLTVESHSSGHAIFSQSASSLGWTCGNMVGRPLEVARFFYDLLGPVPRIVNATTLATMKPTRPFNSHWHSGSPNYKYGAGLMWFMPPLLCNSSDCAYTGHGGDTWGFVSANGFFETLNVSMSLAIACDKCVDILDTLATNFSLTIAGALRRDASSPSSRSSAHATNHVLN